VKQAIQEIWCRGWRLAAAGVGRPVAATLLFQPVLLPTRRRLPAMGAQVPQRQQQLLRRRRRLLDAAWAAFFAF